MPRLRGRLLDRGDDQARDRRLPRPARDPAAQPRPARRPLRRRLGELRLRHHRRRADARGPPRRDGLADRARARDAPGGARPSAARPASSSTSTSPAPTAASRARCCSRSRGQMGEILWREAPVDADLVISVPDSGNPAAAGFARASGLPRDDGLIKNRYVARTFIQPGQELRKHGLRLKFNPLPEIVAGQRIVVVDDSIVRGNTTRQIVGMLRDAGAARGAPADLGAADPQPLPLRRRHVDPRGDDRPRPHDRGDRRRARRRLARLPLDGGRLRGDRRRRRRPLRRLLQRPLPARATPRTRTASSRSRTSPSSRASDGCQLREQRERAVSASSSSPRAPAPTCRRSSTGCTGATGSRSSGSAPTSRRRGRWSGRAAAGVETAVFPADAYDDRTARDAAMADWVEAPRRRPGRPRRLHAAADAGLRRPLPQPDRQRPPGAAAGLPRPRRDRPGARGRGRGDRGHRPLRRRGRRHRAGDPAAARCRCRPGATGEELEAAIHAVEHELYPEAIRMIAGGQG